MTNADWGMAEFLILTMVKPRPILHQQSRATTLPAPTFERVYYRFGRA